MVGPPNGGHRLEVERLKLIDKLLVFCHQPGSHLFVNNLSQ